MRTDQHRLTPSPPLGWNSYDSYGCLINERRALENLEIFVERLKPHGYEYFVIDAGWFRHFGLVDREYPVKGQSYRVLIDDNGRPVPSPDFFPNGFGRLADACHAAGVRFGIHMMRGIPRIAVEERSRIAGSVDATAADIAKTSDICSWCKDMYGVDMERPGAQAYYDSVVAQAAAWGVDFIKYDDIIPSPAEVQAVLEAISKCGRDIVLSLSPGDYHVQSGWPMYMQANLVRTTCDIWDERVGLERAFVRWREFAPIIDQLPHGCWLDMDMIPFGELQVWRPAPDAESPIQLHGMGSRRKSRLSHDQKRTFMTMRALAASPLMMGGDLPGTDNDDFALLTDANMLACNQNGVMGRLVAHAESTSIWVTCDRHRQGSGWFGVFNHDGESARDVIVSADEVGAEPASRLYDIWGRCELGDFATPRRFRIQPDSVAFIRFES